jgi:putative SOS response-associated peptidase YedK
VVEDLGPRWNVAPTDEVYAVAQSSAGPRRLGTFRWGLVPFWSKDAKGGARMINARAETVLEKPAFRRPLERRRCIVPADGFYEWRRDGRVRQPFLIHTATDAPLAFAGLWAPWRDPVDGQWLVSATVVTTTANAIVGELHNRMPVILNEEAWRMWLDPDARDEGLLQSLLVPARDDLLELRPASTLVNNANNEGADLLIAPATPAAVKIDEPALTLFG